MSSYHVTFAPFEAIAMGLPVLFKQDSCLHNEIKPYFSHAELLNLGLCESFSDMAQKAELCLNDISFSKSIAADQSHIISRVFSKNNAFIQAKSLFYEISKNKPSKESLLNYVTFEKKFFTLAEQ